MTDVHAQAKKLREYATHFAFSDWDYTRDLGSLRALRHSTDLTRWQRAKKALHEVFRRHNTSVDEILSVNRFSMARYLLRVDPNLPDGVLDHGNIITHWEETGEYLQMVQPRVGALLATLMDAHPDLPEVQAIAAELERIAERYDRRLLAEQGNK